MKTRAACAMLAVAVGGFYAQAFARTVVGDVAIQDLTLKSDPEVLTAYSSIRLRCIVCKPLAML